MGMKKTILTLLLATAFSFAQNERRGDRLAEHLALSAEQRPQVEAILKEQRETLQTARKNNASRDEMKSIQKKTRERLAAVLTPEQMRKWEAGAQKLKNRRNPGE